MVPSRFSGIGNSCHIQARRDIQRGIFWNHHSIAVLDSRENCDASSSPEAVRVQFSWLLLLDFLSKVQVSKRLNALDLHVRKQAGVLSELRHGGNDRTSYTTSILSMVRDNVLSLLTEDVL